MRPAAWSQRRLFSTSNLAGRTTGNNLPRIGPDEVPTADPDDFVFGPMTAVLAQLLPESPARRETIKQELKAAGYYRPHAWQNLAAIRYVAMMLPLLLFGLLLVLVPPQAEIAVLAMLLFAPPFGWALPRLYVKNRANDRADQIERAFPDMLDMLNMCVSQGLTVPESLERISRELNPVYPALAQELRIVIEQSRIGTFQHALENLAGRIDIEPVKSFTSLLIQTERMGTSISEALAEYSDAMRETLRQRADQQANQAAFKLLFPTVLCLMPAVYIFLLGPAIIELSEFFGTGGFDSLRTGTEALQNLNP